MIFLVIGTALNIFISKHLIETERLLYNSPEMHWKLFKVFVYKPSVRFGYIIFISDIIVIVQNSECSSC